jgi:hypothetical protein
MMHPFKMASGFAEDFTLDTATSPVNSGPDRAFPDERRAFRRIRPPINR